MGADWTDLRERVVAACDDAPLRHRGLVLRLGRAPGTEAVGDDSQKKSRRAAEQERSGLKAERVAWSEEFAVVDPSELVFVDETGVSMATARAHGRSASGSTGPSRTGTERSSRSRRPCGWR